MTNPVAQLGIDVINAVQALRLKRHTLRGVSNGVEIHQIGKPVLLLTYAAAEDFAKEYAVIEHG